MVKLLHQSGKILSFCLLCLMLTPAYAQQLASIGNLASGSLRQQQKNQELLIRVLEEVSKKYEVNFFFDEENVKEKLVEKVKIKGEGIEEILAYILTPLGLTSIKLDNANYMIEKLDKKQQVNKIEYIKPPVIGSEKSTSFSNLNPLIIHFSEQEMVVRGLVTSLTDNEPLPGANVIVKGTTTGTVTDIDGNYSINVPDENAVLVFSSVGYTSEEVAVNGRTVIDVALAENIQSLREIVVVGYGTQERKEVTGSVATVKGSEVIKSPAINVSNSLAGRLPGLVAVGQSGEPGSDYSTLLIRGLNTPGDNSPLIVVDGVPFRSLERIDPSTIESISVVKDASAAIYGSQAANGLILITTKRGKAGNLSVTANFNQGFTRPTRIPELTHAADFATLVNEIDAYRDQPLTYTPDAIQKFRDGSDPWRYPDTNWFDAVLKPWSYQNYANVSVNGGSEKMKMFASLSTRFQDGFYKNSASDYKQHDLRVNFDGTINQYITTAIDISGRLEERNFPTRGSSKIFNELTGSRPDLPAYWPNGLPGPPLDDVEQSNPVVTSTNDAGYSRSDNYVFNLNGKLTIKIPWVEGLSVSGMAALDRGFVFSKTFITPWTLHTWDGFTVDANNLPLLTEGEFGGITRLIQQDDQALRYVGNAILNYEKIFLTNHTVKLLAGVERQQTQSSFLYAYRDNFIGTTLDELFAGSQGSQQNDGSTPGQFRWQHYFGRVNYAFKEKYLAEFVWRYQGTSFFDKSSRFGFFPAVSVAYLISEENFWKDKLSIINTLKLRASWGKTGNDKVPPFQFLAVYEPSYYNFVTLDGSGGLMNNNALFEGVTPNKNAVWEEADQKDIGFDMELLEGKVSITADYFNNLRTKIFIPRNASVPGTTGIRLPEENLGEARNRGFDFNVLFRNYKNNLDYQIGVNGGYNKSKILFIDEAPGIPDYQRSTGHPLFTGYYYRQTFYKAIGIFRDQVAIDNYPHFPEARPGDIIFEDVNGDGQINGDDRVTMDKNWVPTLTGGLNLNIQYRGFDLSVLVQGASGGIRYLLGRGGKEINFLKSFYDQRWTEANPDARFPRTFNRNDEYWVSSENLNTFWLRKTDYVRLKNVELGYSLPVSLVDQWGIQNVRFYINALNLLTYSPDFKDFDPELEPKGDGFAGQGYPLQKVINTGISVQF